MFKIHRLGTATPRCGHCKQFAPFYFEVGAHFALDENVRVARIDVDTHRGKQEADRLTTSSSSPPLVSRRRRLNSRTFQASLATNMSDGIHHHHTYIVYRYTTNMSDGIHHHHIYIVYRYTTNMSDDIEHVCTDTLLSLF